MTDAVIATVPVGTFPGGVGVNPTTERVYVANEGSNSVSVIQDDATDPETQIDSGPAGPTSDATPTFTFSSNEGGSTFECRVDSAPFASCTSPHTTGVLAGGPHTFEVRATDPAGHTDQSPASRSFTVQIAVDLDIMPGSDSNSINTSSRGLIPVAILSTPDFDAPGQVDKQSLTFGASGDEESLAKCPKSAEDVNDDGLLDQVCLFLAGEAGFQLGDTEGVLKGTTLGGTPIEGTDSVRIVR